MLEYWNDGHGPPGGGAYSPERTLGGSMNAPPEAVRFMFSGVSAENIKKKMPLRPWRPCGEY